MLLYTKKGGRVNIISKYMRKEKGALHGRTFPPRKIFFGILTLKFLYNNKLKPAAKD